jgi:hypothetical protein
MLSLMAKEFFAHSPLMLYPVVALVLFFTVFSLLTWRTLRRPKQELDVFADMPLADDVPASQPGESR